MDEKTINGLKKKYKAIPALMFHRSLEHAKSGGELFDILDDLLALIKGKKLPVAWCYDEKCWKKVDDMIESNKMEI